MTALECTFPLSVCHQFNDVHLYLINFASSTGSTFAELAAVVKASQELFACACVLFVTASKFSISLIKYQHAELETVMRG